MTLESTERRTEVLGNGAATEFSSVFTVHAAAHLALTHVATDGTETSLVLDTDYEASLDSETGVATITFPKAGSGWSTLATGESLVMVRDVPLTQELDLQNYGEFNVELIERAFDRLTMVAQQLQEQLDRTLMHPVGSTDGQSIEDFVTSINAVLSASQAARDAAVVAKNASETAQSGAETAEDNAEAWAAGLNLPPLTAADAGKGLLVGADGAYGLDVLPRPNLLVNPDFNVNQRDVPTTTGTTYATGAYTADRWYLVGTATNPDVWLDSGELRGEANAAESAQIAFRQKVEKYAKFQGETVTLSSAITTDISGVCIGIYDGVSWTYSSDVAADDAQHEVSVTKTLDAAATELTVQFGMDAAASISVGEYFKAGWTKLEIGNVATKYIPPDPAMELLRCQRYYIRYDTVAYYSWLGVWRDATGYLVAALSLPVSMRTTPSVAFNSTMYMGIAEGAVNDISGVTIHSSNKNIVVVYFTPATTTGLTNGDVVPIAVSANGYLELDAEL